MEPQSENKTKPLSKEETKGLLSLIECSKIINNKATTATNNKMKVEEWQKIADAFNSSIGICRRTPQQLRLKWENLIKNSRKRITLMQMKRIKTGGGPQTYFPPDDILDRVAALLGSRGEGFSVMFGGDAVSHYIVDDGGGSSSGITNVVPLEPLNESLIVMPTPPTASEMSPNGTGVGLEKSAPIALNHKRHLKSTGNL